MRELNPFPSLPQTIPTAAEPPRKRQRTTERELNVATAGTSPASSPGPLSGAAAASTHESMSVSSPTSSWGPRSPLSMSRLGGTHESSDTQLGAYTASSASEGGGVPLCDASRTVAEGSSADAARSGATRHGHSSSVVANVRSGDGTRGDVGGSPPGMKGGRKGKAKAKEEDSDNEGEMNWEPVQSEPRRAQVSIQGGAHAIATFNSPLAVRRQHIIVGEQHQLSGPDGGDGGQGLAPVRDEEFYIDSADCVIRVEGTLFRVHRYFLGRDSSAFEHMFSMPSEGSALSHNVEGCSDENPVQLFGESVERFRALLSVIYDLPLQLQAYNTPAANIDRLVTIAEMTNKYHFVTIEAWAVGALYNVISCLHGPPPEQYQLGHCSSAWMKRLLEVALLCGHTSLRDYVAEQWVDRIIARDLRPVHALEIADRSGIKRLQGYAYYVQLLEMGENFEPGVLEDGKQYARSRLATAAAAGPNWDNGNDSPSASPGTPARLTRAQRQRLLSGHWSLSRLWETLRASPPKFERQDGCTYHQQGCVSTWTHVWRDVGKSELTLKHPPGDVLGRLKAMAEQLYMHADLSSALTPQCKRLALMALRSTIKEVQEGLADHFADLTLETNINSTEEKEACSTH